MMSQAVQAYKPYLEKHQIDPTSVSLESYIIAVLGMPCQGYV